MEVMIRNSCCHDSMLFSFSLDSDFIKSDFFNYDFSFQLSTIIRFCSSLVPLRELDRER